MIGLLDQASVGGSLHWRAREDGRLSLIGRLFVATRVRHIFGQNHFRAIVRFVNAAQSGSEAEHLVAQRDDDELANQRSVWQEITGQNYLCIFCPVLDVVRDDGDVFNVQGCVNFVHHVQGCRFVVM